MTVATGSQGGDITQPWQRARGTGVQWTTFDTGPLWERQQREATLPQTTMDVGFVLNTQVAPRAAQLFEPLDEWLRRDPIDDVPDIFPGLIEGYRVGGALVAIPFRHASSGLHYNEELFAERGITGAPKTIEEMADFARRATFRRADGTPVTGLVMPGVTYPNVIDIARAWDGDFITADFRCIADQPPMLNAIRMLRELFQANAFPRNFASIQTEDVNTWIQQGRGAMALQFHGPQPHLQRSRRAADSPARCTPSPCRSPRRCAAATRSRRPRWSSGAWPSRATAGGRNSPGPSSRRC